MNLILLLSSFAALGTASVHVEEGALPLHYRSPGAIDATSFPKEDHQRHAHRLLRAATRSISDTPSTASSRIVNPIDHGADPTGALDSSTAFDKAVSALLALESSKNLEGQGDLGGAVLDLAGGMYNLSRSVTIPHGYANFRVQRGTLLAGPSFPSSSYLLQIGDSMDCKHTSGGASNKNCMSNVGVQQITLAGNGRAFGGVMIENTMDANVGPAVMVTGFSGVGINLAGTGAGSPPPSPSLRPKQHACLHKRFS